MEDLFNETFKGLKSGSWDDQVAILRKSYAQLLPHDEKKTMNQQKESFQEFEAWLTKNGVDLQGMVEFGHIEELGCNGVKCKLAMEKDQVAFKVPRKVMLAADDYRKNRALAQLVETDPILRTTAQVVLALLLLIEVQKGKDSFYKPYIDILPRQCPGLPLVWSIEELESLKGTEAGFLSLNRSLNCVMCYIHLFHRLKGKMDPIVKKTNQVTFEMFRWAVAIAMTRQNPVPSKETPEVMDLALIPVFDMCNHEPGEFTTSFDPEQDQLVCKALRNFQQGEEFRIFYGPRPNTELLVYCGFLLNVGENQYDQFKTNEFQFLENDPLIKVKQLVLNKAGIVSINRFVQFPSDKATSIARIIIADKEELGLLLRAQQENADGSIPFISDTHESKVNVYLEKFTQDLITTKRAALETTTNTLAHKLLQNELHILDNL